MFSHFPVSWSCDSYNLSLMWHIVFNNHIYVLIDNEGICPKPSTQTHAQKFGFVFIYCWLKSVAAFTPGIKIRFLRRPYWNWIVLLTMKLQTWINTEDRLWSHLSSEGGKGCNVTALNTEVKEICGWIHKGGGSKKKKKTLNTGRGMSGGRNRRRRWR